MLVSMERDFMGLNLKDPMAMVKEETVDGGKDQGMKMISSGLIRVFFFFELEFDAWKLKYSDLFGCLDEFCFRFRPCRGTFFLCL